MQSRQGCGSILEPLREEVFWRREISPLVHKNQSESALKKTFCRFWKLALSIDFFAESQLTLISLASYFKPCQKFFFFKRTFELACNTWANLRDRVMLNGILAWHGRLREKVLGTQCLFCRLRDWFCFFLFFFICLPLSISFLSSSPPTFKISFYAFYLLNPKKKNNKQNKFRTTVIVKLLGMLLLLPLFFLHPQPPAQCWARR